MTTTLPALSIQDSLTQYQRSIRNYSTLSAEEEFSLATRLRNNNDLEAAKQLVFAHLKLVVSIARGYQGYGLPLADLVQEGNVGLMKAVKRFDPTRGVRLVTFAVFWIKAEIHDFIIKNWRLVKIVTTKAQKKLFFNLRSLKKGHTLRGADIANIAAQLNVKPEEVKEMEMRMTNGEISLEGESSEENENAFAPIAFLQDKGHTPEEKLIDEQTDTGNLSALTLALQKLDARSRRIIETRWLDENESKTLHELADEFGISAERVRQIEQQAMAKIKTSITRTLN